MRTKTLGYLAAALSSSLFFSACGGGGGVAPSAVPSAPSRSEQPLNVPISETLFVGYQQYLFNAGGEGFDGSILQTVNTETGAQSSLPGLWKKYDGLSAIAVSPDRRTLVMGNQRAGGCGGVGGGNGAQETGLLSFDLKTEQYGPYLFYGPGYPGGVSGQESVAQSGNGNVAWFVGDDVYNSPTLFKYVFSTGASADYTVPAAPPNLGCGFQTEGIATNHDGSIVYVADNSSTSSRVETVNGSGAIVSTVALPTRTQTLLLDERNSRLYAASVDNAALYEIDTSTHRLLGTTQLDPDNGGGTLAATIAASNAVSTYAERLYAVRGSSIEVLSVSGGTPHKIGDFAASRISFLALNPPGNHLYTIANAGTSPSIQERDAKSGSLLRNIPVVPNGQSPNGDYVQLVPITLTVR